VRDIAKDEGIDTTRKTNEELRNEILNKRREKEAKDNAQKPAEDAKKRQDEMKPGKQGEKDKPKQDEGVLKTISSAVDAIKTAVINLEKKLPQPALGY
jgi:hypothetical protein